MVPRSHHVATQSFINIYSKIVTVLSNVRHQAISWINSSLLISPMGINLFLKWICNQTTTFSFKKKYLKIFSARWISDYQPFCSGLTEVKAYFGGTCTYNVLALPASQPDHYSWHLSAWSGLLVERLAPCLMVTSGNEPLALEPA